MSYIKVPVKKITCPENRARSLDPVWAEALAVLFKDHGNKVAIEVRRSEVEGEFILVAGLHRLEAAKICEWSEMTVKLIGAESEHEAEEFKLHEIMENIGRRELNILDRAHHLYELKQVYGRLHPEVKKGGDHGNQHTGGKKRQTAIFAFSQDMAEKIGLSERSIDTAVKLWNDLSPETRRRVDGTFLADHQAGLMTLAGEKPAKQKKILDLVFDEKAEPKNVAEAVVFLEQGKVVKGTVAKIVALNKTIKKLDDPAFNQLLDLNEARVRAWLESRG